MALEAEEAVGQGVIALFLQQGDGKELALGLAHLAGIGVQVEDMHPIIAPFMAQIGLRLGDFVGVVGESVIDAAAVNIQVLAQVLHGDAGALNVPAGVAHAPGRIPLQGLVLKLGLGEPEDKVVLVALVAVLLHALTDAHSQVFLVEVVKDVVLLQLGGVKVHVAAGKVGIAGVHQLGDDADIVVNAVGGRLHHVGGLDVQLGAVGEEGVGIEPGDLHDGLMLPLGALEHLILALVGIGGQVAHVGNVHDPLHVIANVAQVLLQHVLHDVGTQVADMGKVVDSRAAGVHLHDVRMVGNKFFFGAGSGIVKFHFISPQSAFLNTSRLT